MTGGKGLDEFRKEFLTDTHLVSLEDFSSSKDCFQNNDIKGGVSIFLWDRNYNGPCKITYHYNNQTQISTRYLKETDLDIYVRDERLLNIKKKVSRLNERTFDAIVSARKPYGLDADTMASAAKYGLPDFSDKHVGKIGSEFSIIGLDQSQKRIWKYLPLDYPLPKHSSCIDKYKVFVAKAFGNGTFGETISEPILAHPKEICTETFLEIGPFDTEQEAQNVIYYIKTKFFRTLVGVQKQTQNTAQKTYRSVPLLNFKSDSEIIWSDNIQLLDEQLYKKYDLTPDEIQYIEDNVQVML